MNASLRTYCNPLNLNYRFQVRGWAKACLREAADPSVAYYQGEYWLFASKSGGYWHSPDLRSWRFVKTTSLPLENYAPDIRVVDGALLFTANQNNDNSPCPIFRSRNPAADEWERVADCDFSHDDPNIFQDDDGKVYLYWGCSCSKPIKGVELDRLTMAPRGAPIDLFAANTELHGWERKSEDNADGPPAFIEGPWMTKHAGKYYLQYAAPGTMLNVYGDGVYCSNNPLGPFRYAAHNPFSFKPGGFITGAGHGSTFYDSYGNLWHVATMRITVKHKFERRIGLFPAGFDQDGILFCNTSFGDYPLRLPCGRWDPLRDPFTGWMLLSYNKPAGASSSLAGFKPDYAVNEDIRNYWSAKTGEAGEWLRVDLGQVCSIRAVQINFAEHLCRQYGREDGALFHQYLLEISADGQTWTIAHDRRNTEQDTPHDYVEFPVPLRGRHVRITNAHTPAKGMFAVAGLRVFGQGPGRAPDAIAGDAQIRFDPSRLQADIDWTPAAGAIGYNVYWGLAPDKLYNSWLLYGRSALVLRALNGGQACFVRIDPFNENGVTPGTVQLITKG